jgi:hypothetical protein
MKKKSFRMGKIFEIYAGQIDNKELISRALKNSQNSVRKRKGRKGGRGKRAK